MINQAPVEAIHSATYIENYLEFVENLPDELQRLISRVHELDCLLNEKLEEVEQKCHAFILGVETSAKRNNLIFKVQNALICAQELGDEKLQVLQQVQDIIENKTRQLDIDYKNLANVGKDPDSADFTKDGSNREGFAFGINNGERQSKRVRRTRTDTAHPNDQLASMDSLPTPEPLRQVQQIIQQTSTSINSASTQKKTGVAAMGKKKKRKTRQVAQQSSQRDSQASGRDSQRDDSPARDDEMLVDPDEPTYCLCDQISYGEMIMCDNDICPYEWFHFSCVSLGVKPKGKWYCPKCRGDRSSVMKPKAQIRKELKEIERLKQEKEVKDEKAS